MSKFNSSVRPAVSSPIQTEVFSSGHTYEGGAGYARDTKSELYLLAVANMVGEDTFYESAGTRDSRFAELVRQATNEDAQWTADLLYWLRKDANMRSAALVGVVEYTRARAELTGASHIPYGRQVVNSVLQRADEPGELLAYYVSNYGRQIPLPIKKGVADAAVRLYDERSLLKWDSAERSYRFGDVIELTHPAPKADWQSDLFRYAIDRRHGHRGTEILPTSLSTLYHRSVLMDIPIEERRAVLELPSAGELLKLAGMTWESLAGWLNGPMDRQAWEAIIPSMGYMALLRNLRNFDQADVSDEVAARVAAKLSDPDEVAKSRQLPMRFLSAYRAAPSLRWSYPLERALNYSLANVPQLTGRTLILVDTSGSMHAPFSKDGTLMRWDAAVVFGLALASRCSEADVVSFSNGYYGNDGSKVFPQIRGESVLAGIQRWQSDGYFIGAGTDTAGALVKHFARHDRVVILTDEQAAYGDVGSILPPRTPLYTWNLAGYRYGHAPSGTTYRHTFGGLTDQGFRMIPLLESGRDGAWPWKA